MSINKVILVGRLGADPEVHYFEGGGCVARVSLATNEWYRDKRGESHQLTEWHRLALWNRLAESAERQLRKGSLVYVEGRLTYRTWEDRDKKTHRVTEVVVLRLQFLGSRSVAPSAGPSNEDGTDLDLQEMDGGEDAPLLPF